MGSLDVLVSKVYVKMRQWAIAILYQWFFVLSATVYLQVHFASIVYCFQCLLLYVCVVWFCTVLYICDVFIVLYVF